MGSAPTSSPGAEPPSQPSGTPASVAEAEAHLAALDAERARTLATLARLRAAASAPRTVEPTPSRASPPAPPTHPDTRSSSPTPLSPTEKVALFRRLFRGRDDVYPRLWVSERAGKKGYAPACANEWVRGVCEKPRVRCGACANRAFLPVTDDVVLAHLRGHHVIGVYPLLPDETCCFLAADFDEQTWRDDLLALDRTCRELGVPITLERSRSGNGGHAWFFFDEPVSAAAARRMGCFLLTETMARHRDLSLKSYDRLFPSQDTMPRGGFGNLIALPLQHEARQRGHTLFLDEHLEPYADPWAYLRGLQPMSRATVESLAAQASREGRVLGIPLPATEADGEPAPWSRTPSRPRRALAIDGPLPARVRVVVAQRLFVEKAGLPSPLVAAIKRLAAFQNPEFYARQGMRLSTALTPRVIGCAEETALHVGLPRGCEEGLRELLAHHAIALELADERTGGIDLQVTFHGQLTDVQQRAVEALHLHDHGVFVAPPGVGKTVIGIRLIAERARNTLVLVHRKPLVDQWRARLALFLGLPPKEIGVIGAGRRKGNGRLDVAMIQSLVREGVVSDVVASYGHVVVDECHHVSAVSFERVLSEVKARYVTGLTATPHRRDGHDPIITMQCGPIRFAISPRDPSSKPAFRQRLRVRDTAFSLRPDAPVPAIQELYALLVADPARNDLIVADVRAVLAEGRSPLVLTERRDHLEALADGLRAHAPQLMTLHGGLGARRRRAEVARLAQLPASEPRLVLATGRFAGEGFDDPRLDTLFLALPVSWRGTLVQYAGRLHRLHPGKEEVRIYDYVDRAVPALARMFERRSRGYRAIGYSSDGAGADGAASPGAVREERPPVE